MWNQSLERKWAATSHISHYLSRMEALGKLIEIRKIHSKWKILCRSKWHRIIIINSIAFRRMGWCNQQRYQYFSNAIKKQRPRCNSVGVLFFIAVFIIIKPFITLIERELESLKSMTIWDCIPLCRHAKKNKSKHAHRNNRITNHKTPEC